MTLPGLPAPCAGEKSRRKISDQEMMANIIFMLTLHLVSGVSHWKRCGRLPEFFHGLEKYTALKKAEAAADLASVEAEPCSVTVTTEIEPPKPRKRRTKAEMAAAKAKSLAYARDIADGLAGDACVMAAMHREGLDGELSATAPRLRPRVAGGLACENGYRIGGSVPASTSRHSVYASMPR